MCPLSLEYQASHINLINFSIDQLNRPVLDIGGRNRILTAENKEHLFQSELCLAPNSHLINIYCINQSGMIRQPERPEHHTPCMTQYPGETYVPYGWKERSPMELLSCRPRCIWINPATEHEALVHTTKKSLGWHCQGKSPIPLAGRSYVSFLTLPEATAQLSPYSLS